MARILGAGLAALDHIFLVNGRAIRSGNIQFLASSGGGSVGNALCMLQLLGHQTSMIGVLGNDIAGSLIRNDFRKFGVNSKCLTVHGSLGENRSTRQFSHVIYSDGRHAFKDSCLKCQSEFKSEVHVTESDFDELTKNLARSAECLLLDRANKFTIKLAETAKSQGVKVGFDYSYETRKGGSRTTNDLLSLCDFVKVSDGVITRRLGNNLADVSKLFQRDFPGMANLMITRGEKGVYGYGITEIGRLYFDLNSFNCDNFRDAAGAGDIFTSVIISELILNKEIPEDLDELVNRINLAQALATLNCTIYGARSLQRILQMKRVGHNDIIKIGRDIIEEGRVGNSFNPDIGLPINSIPSFRFALETSCDVCGIPLRKSQKTKVKKQTQYVTDLSSAREVMIHAFEMGIGSRPSVQQFSKSPMLFIGSGGSLVAAIFGEQLMTRATGMLSKAIAPYDFEHISNLDKNVATCLISYGGENLDILGAAQHLIEIGAKNCFVLTGTKDSTLVRKAKENGWPIISLICQDRGFVATVGLLGLVSSMSGLLTPETDLEDVRTFFNHGNIYDIFHTAERTARDHVNDITVESGSLHIVALGSGWSWVSVADLESKMVEGGVCTVEVSELKNYTHGRYINAFHHRQNRHFILFKTPAEEELVDYLQKRLRRYFGITIIETKKSGLCGSLELLVQELLLSYHLGKKIGRDISKPKYPPEARGLYSWRPCED